MVSRAGTAMRNAGYAAFGQLLTSAIGFATRTVFIHTLSAEYVGIHGLFTSVLAVLSFAELGIGTSMTFALYRPLSLGAYDEVAALMRLFAKAYRVVALVVAGVGAALAPFLPFLIKGDPGVPDLYALYFVFLLNSVLSYLLSYSRSLLIASENGHLDVRNRIGFLVVQNACQILALLALPSYMLFLVLQLGVQLASNIAVTRRVHLMFPGVLFRREGVVSSDTLAVLRKNVAGMMFHKFGSVAVSTSTTLFISAFVGVIAVAQYSNYILLTGMSGAVIVQAVAALAPSVGNLNVQAPSDVLRVAFERILFLNVVMVALVASCFAVVLNPFVGVWAGPDYVLAPHITALIVLNFYLYGIRQPAITFINAMGLFWMIRYKSLVEAAVSVGMSALLLIVFNLGVFGALLSVTASTLLTNIWWEPYVVWRGAFHVGLRRYWLLLFRYSASAGIAVCLSVLVTDAIAVTGIPGLLVGGVTSTVITALVFFGFHRRDPNLIYALGLVRQRRFSQ